MATGDRPWSDFPTSTTLDDNSDFLAFVDVSQPLPEDRNRTITLDNFASELYTNGRTLGTLAVLNAAITDATLDDASDPRPPTAHASDHESGGTDTIDHDNLVGFVANEHIDHSSVVLTAGEGIAGGGDITASRTFDLDIDGLVEEAGIDTTADFVAFYDVDAGVHRKIHPDDLGVGGGGVGSTVFDFDADTGTTETTVDDVVAFSFPKVGPVRSIIGSEQLPTGIDLSAIDPDITIHFVITSTGGGSADVRFELEATYIADGELTTKAIDETLTQDVTVTDTLKTQHSVTFTLDRTLMSLNDVVRLKLSRLNSDPNDTYTGDVAAYERARFEFEG